MKRLLIIGLALAAFASAGIARAQSIAASCDDVPTPTSALGTCTCPSGYTLSGSGALCTPSSNGGTAAPSSSDGSGGTASTQNNGAQQSGLNGDPSAAFGWLLGGIMTIFAWLAGTAGVILNDAVYYTVVQMGSIVNPNNLNAIGVSWRILRDLGNIVLIFGFLAIGISTIIGYDNYGVGRRLPMLLIVAICINFSLFATEAVIDVGNLFATEFYTQINGGSTPTPQGISNVNPVNGGISGTVMSTLALQSLYNIGGQNQKGNALPTTGSGVTDSKVMLVGILGTILFLILAFVLFSLAIILIARFVALVFLMIVAPLGFAGLVVPGLEKTARSWWSTLFEQVVTAPVLLLMLYVALAVITDAKFLTGFGAAGGNYAAIAGGSTGPSDITGYAGLLLAFIVAMGLLLACVVMAKKMSAFGASFATNMGAKASFGVTAAVGRRTVGRVSNFASKRISSSALGRTEIGRTLLSVTDAGAKASFDLRGSKALQGLAKGQGIDLGKAQEGGYKKIRDDAAEARVKHAERLELTGKEAAQKKGLEDALETAKKKQIRDLLAADQLPDAQRKVARDKANDDYKASERRIQFGRYEGEKQVEKGLSDYKDLPQKKYIEHLEARATPFSAGILQDAVARGVAAGATEALGLGIAGVALGTAAKAGAGIGAAIGVGYVSGVAPGANADAIKKLRKKIKDQSLDQLRKALASGGGGGGGGTAAGGGAGGEEP